MQDLGVSQGMNFLQRSNDPGSEFADRRKRLDAQLMVDKGQAKRGTYLWLGWQAWLH